MTPDARQLNNMGNQDTGAYLGTRWSMDFAQCVKCGKTDSAYSNRGKCHRCVSKERYDSKEGGIKVRKAMEKWRAENPEKVREYHRKHRQKIQSIPERREKLSEYHREWRKKNPEKIKAIGEKYRKKHGRNINK